MEKYLPVQVKRTNGTIDKGVVVKDVLSDALQGYHAYLGAYAFNHDPNTDYVFAAVFDHGGEMLEQYVDDRTDQPTQQAE